MAAGCGAVRFADFYAENGGEPQRAAKKHFGALRAKRIIPSPRPFALLRHSPRESATPAGAAAVA
jgi:hypothetical protein